MTLNNILLFLIIGVILLILFNPKCEGFADMTNKSISFQDNSGNKYSLVPYNNLKTEYKTIIKNILFSNAEYMKNENAERINNTNDFNKNALVLVKDTDISKYSDNVNLLFKLVDNGNSNYAISPIIDNKENVDQYIYFDNDIIYYFNDGNDLLETKKNVYLKNYNDGLYTLTKNNNNNPVNINIL
jgi:hypothetical protein